MDWSFLRNQGGVSQPIPVMPTPVVMNPPPHGHPHNNPLPGPSNPPAVAPPRPPCGNMKKFPTSDEELRDLEIPQHSDMGEDKNTDSGEDWGSDEAEDEDDEGTVVVVPNPSGWGQSELPVPHFPGFVSPGHSNGQLQAQSMWSPNPQPQRVRQFSGASGMKVTPPGEDPIDYFLTLFCEEMFQLILEETNHQAQISTCTTVAPKSRIRGWKPLSRADFDVFLGLLYLTGQVQAPSFDHYWQSNLIYNYPQFRNAMGRDRFLLILRQLHFARSPRPGEPKPTDPLFKVKPILDLFHKRMAEVYYPTKELCLDEPMMLWQGSLFFRQYIQNKKQKYDLKFYTLAQPNGLVLKLRIYCGSADKEVGGKGHADKVVRHLLSDYLGVGHSVYMDSFYTSLELTNYLLNQGTYVTGTLRANRKGNPLRVINKNLGKQGEMEAAYTSNGICVVKFHDKRDVTVMSAEYATAMTANKVRSGKVTQKPKAVAKYHENMVANDQSEQLFAYYPGHRKNVRWYAKAAIHIFHIIMNNAYLLYKANTNKKMKLLEFRDQVISALIYKHRPPVGTLVFETPKAGAYHVPTEVPRNEKNRKVRRRCVVCREQGLRQESTYYCNLCPKKPGLCLEQCFAKFHKYKQ